MASRREKATYTVEEASEGDWTGEGDTTGGGERRLERDTATSREKCDYTGEGG